ncbi:hypothetical protein BITS_0019 [Bifidobacterium tsurumiense]|uniref:DUF4125 family protein n=2 Tax=Bifidobacterium tsurumiense TaxID=356829 RepID=A0A087EC60_9BIFI|nr:hypothetical protein BITS_0019 [Bifidobacterium tsurumiense]
MDEYTDNGTTHHNREQTMQGTQKSTALTERIVQLEWEQFQNTTNEGGPASCQSNWPMFHEMRMSQFLTWPESLLQSYESDLQEADSIGRNLVTEKYARMMQSTAPEEYRHHIEPYLATLDHHRIDQQERIIAIQVQWADDFRSRYPKLGSAMRTLRTSEDTEQTTSFETYLRGELSTYSDSTLHEYESFIHELQAEHKNLTELTIANTVKLAGFAGLEEAESAQ